MGTAELIARLDGFNGDARVYRCSPPMRGWSWDDDEDVPSYEYVIVSAAVVPLSGPETYIFGSDENWAVVNWGELPGSTRGTLDHEEVLREAGYVVGLIAEV